MKYIIYQDQLNPETSQSVMQEKAIAMLGDEDATVQYAREHFNNLYIEVYTGTTEELPIEDALAYLFRILNTNQPEDYHARSLSCGDVVYLESGTVSAFYVVTTRGFKLLPIVRSRIDKPLSDGTVLTAEVWHDTDYPGIRIYLHKPDGHDECLCFAEFNSNKPADMQLCICAYSRDIDEPAYYESYNAPGSPSPNI
jgi:hypothetical protein